MIRSSKLFWVYFRLGFFVVVPVVLLILPSDVFDEGPVTCLSRILFNLECYGCGLTRSIQHLIHFEFQDAWFFNPLGFIVFPVLAFQWARWFFKDWKRLKTNRLQTQ